MYEIKQLSQEEISDLQLQYPYTDIKEYQLLDDGMCLGYTLTYDEAQDEIRKWEGRGAIQSTIDDKLPYLIDELERQGSFYGLESAEIHDMLRNAV